MEWSGGEVEWIGGEVEWTGGEVEWTGGELEWIAAGCSVHVDCVCSLLYIHVYVRMLCVHLQLCYQSAFILVGCPIISTVSKSCCSSYLEILIYVSMHSACGSYDSALCAHCCAWLRVEGSSG